LVLSPLVSAEIIVNLGDYTVSNPEITITASEPVRLDIKALTSADFKTVYPLCVEPAPGSAVYEQAYSLFTKSGVPDGSCDGGTTHYLAPGDYLLRLEATDRSGLKVISLVQFRIFGLTITQTAPASLVSPSSPASITFVTEKSKPAVGNDPPVPEPAASVCRYGAQLPQGKTLAQTRFEDLTGLVSNGQKLSTHTLSFAVQGDIYVICKEEVTAGQDAKAAMRLQYDLTRPVITHTLTPQRVTTVRDGKGLVRVTAQTDDSSACRIDAASGSTMFFDESFADYGTYAVAHTTEIEYDPLVVGIVEKNFSYTLYCRNLAGHSNTTQFNVTVNFADAVDLRILEPDELINTPVMDLIVLPTFYNPVNPSINECYVNDNGDKRQTNRMTEGSIIDENGYDATVYSASFSFADDGSQDGKKEFVVDCYGRKTASVTHNVTIDSIRPAMPFVNASSLICGGNITVQFNSTDRGLGIVGYNYTAYDDNGVLTTGVTTRTGVSFRPSRSVEGTLTWAVFAIDAAGNKGPIGMDSVVAVRVGEDEQCGLPPFIRLVSPEMGFALAKPYDLELATSRPAVCRYALLNSIPWSSLTPFTASNAGKTHEKTGLQDTDKLLYVTCNETAANRLHRTEVRIGIDNTAPRISLDDLGTNPIIDQANKIIILKVRTDDLTYCYVDGEPITQGKDDVQGTYTRDHSATLDYRHITATDRQVFERTVMCRNLAMLSNSSTYEAIVHLGNDFGIEVLSPQQYIAQSQALLSIRPNKQADCVWRFAGGEEQIFTDVSNNIHNVTLIDLEDKSHQVIISCTGAGDEGTRSWTFTVDSSVPGIEDLRGPTILCPGVTAVYHFNITGLDPAPVLSYTLTASNGAGAQFAQNTTDAVISINTATLLPATYELAITPINRAGTRGNAATISLEVKSRTAAACTVPEDHCTNKELDEGEEGIDCGGTCPNTCVPCVDDLECEVGETCESNVCVDAGCSDDNQCRDGEACIEGVCALSGCFPECGEGQVCDNEAHSCVAIIDCTTEACPAGLTCSAEKACVVVPQCSETVPCETGFTCDQQNRCVEILGCVDSADCGGLACTDGLCVPSGTCDTALSCESGQICTLNSTCAAVKECIATTGCPKGLTCTDDGLCAAATVCSPGAPCPTQASACTEAGFCIAIEGCSISLDCPEGLSCIDNRCAQVPPTPSGCVDDTGCGEGQECSYGICRYPLSDECSTDVPCPTGQLCSYGSCIPDYGDDDPDDPADPDDTESHLLSILLIALGLAIMGGAGYFLYQQNQEKEADARRQALVTQARPVRQRPAGQMSPQLAASYEQNKEQRQAALQAEYERRQSEKAKREATFQEFGQAKKDEAIKTQATQKTEKPKDEAPDEYVDLTKLRKSAKDSANVSKGTAKSTAKDKDEDVFDELEKIGK
jgi:hypothetical protein